jgi:hypothetical protein
MRRGRGGRGEKEGREGTPELLYRTHHTHRSIMVRMTFLMTPPPTTRPQNFTPTLPLQNGCGTSKPTSFVTKNALLFSNPTKPQKPTEPEATASKTLKMQYDKDLKRWESQTDLWESGDAISSHTSTSR